MLGAIQRVTKLLLSKTLSLYHSAAKSVVLVGLGRINDVLQ